MPDASSEEAYAALRLELLADIHAHGAAAVFRARGTDIVRMYELGKQRRGVERDLAGADPRIWEYLSHLPPDVLAAERARLTNPRGGGPARSRPAAGRRGTVAHTVRDLPDVREGNGTPVLVAERLEFENWGRTVSNVPAVTAVPKTKSGLISVLRWAAARGYTVRAAGYRHTWSDLFSADGEVLISMLPLDDVEDLPSPEPPIDPADDLQGIELVGSLVEDGVTRALCRIGAATTNEQFRRWCLDQRGGAWMWTVPFNVIMVEITWGGSNAPICHGAGRTHGTLSDLVTEIEFVNARGDLQVVSDPQLLHAAAGCFGLLGIVTSLTLKLDPMSYATLRPRKTRLALTIPPPAGFAIPDAVDMSGISHGDLERARTQRAWWDAIAAVLTRSDAPMRVALEMRIMGGSAITMAPQYGNELATCSIEVLTSEVTPEPEWTAFIQDVADRWMSYTDALGNPLGVRPHWAKQWQSLELRGRPSVEYLRDVAYPARITEFRAGLDIIAAQGGYRLSDLRLFSNPLLDQLFARVFR